EVAARVARIPMDGVLPEIEMRRAANRGIAACLGTALLALWGCSNLPTAPNVGGGETSPGFLRVPTGAAGAFGSSGPGGGGGSGVVDGERGGTVTNGRFQLRIPPGAFAGTATISIVVPDPAVLRCELGFSPASVNGFRAPVQLAVRYRSPSGPRRGRPPGRPARRRCR